MLDFLFKILIFCLCFQKLGFIFFCFRAHFFPKSFNEALVEFFLLLYLFLDSVDGFLILSDLLLLLNNHLERYYHSWDVYLSALMEAGLGSLKKDYDSENTFYRYKKLEKCPLDV